jgi:DNA-binding NtrC family response regulator
MTKILIIESSPPVRNALREKLEYEKYEVWAVATPEEGLPSEETFRPDVVLVDRLYDHKKVLNAPFIVLSNDNSLDNALESVRAGAWDFIPKPVDMNVLLDSIRQAAASERVETTIHN